MKYKYLGLLVFIVILAVIAVPVSNYFVKLKIEKALHNLPEHINVNTEDIHVDVVSGTVEFKDVLISVLNKTTQEKSIKLNLSNILIEDIDYIEFVFYNKVSIEALEIDAPKVTYYKAGKQKKPTSAYEASETPEVVIKNVKITNGAAQVLSLQNDSLLFDIKSFKINLKDLKHHPDKKNRMPVTFQDFDIEADSIQLNVGAYDRLFISQAQLKDHASVLKAVQLKTMFSKKELSKHITTERDHFNLGVDSIVINEVDFGYKQDTIFYFTTNKAALHHLDFNIYRDKLVADDYTIKSLYGKMLRELNFDLNVKELQVYDGKIVYEERVHHSGVPGEIFFTDFNATMSNINNTYPEGDKTVVNITARFMDEAPLKAYCDFDINNEYDRFLFKAELGSFHAEKMNQFLVPNLNVKFEGILHKTYFTIDATANHSSIDLKTDFDGLRVDILRKHKHKKNKFLSAIANIFVKKTTEHGDSAFAEAKRHGIKRDKTKSVFNFLWLNVKEGLLHAKN
ncbi:hypothetical protein JJL45_10160 [Tamlana sp. s12]|uniref:hypothetical protein n=1 Tax=Tamlana sp. s12 TaxID=1630406 RepID=UPI0008017A12|nr:hypothetical protein [Tamlana sp. s12]OBQ54187.1 hypothetical protein VQ01_12110 [Tamlana sp. s12]QQY81292.1 hypothetical protein JJL45_10160 [Tamlana sp. s12]